jgi:hypothetical protein
MNKPAGSPLPARVYDIRIRSLRAAVEHMTLTDLTELRESAELHGSAADLVLIDAVRKLINRLSLHRHS